MPKDINREQDKTIAEEVMDWRFVEFAGTDWFGLSRNASYRRVPFFTTDIADAMTIIDKLDGDGCCIRIFNMPMWTVEIEGCEGKAQTLIDAICSAVMKYVGVDE